MRTLCFVQRKTNYSQTRDDSLIPLALYACCVVINIEIYAAMNIKIIIYILLKLPKDATISHER